MAWTGWTGHRCSCSDRGRGFPGWLAALSCGSRMLLQIASADSIGRGVQTGLRMRAISPWRAGGTPDPATKYRNVLKCLPGLSAKRREPQVGLLPGPIDALLLSGPLLPKRNVALQDRTFEGAFLGNARTTCAPLEGFRFRVAELWSIQVPHPRGRKYSPADPHRHARK